MLLISEYKIGMAAELTRSFSDEDVYLFSKLSGDINPVHLDENYAKETIFGARIVHGALVSSVFSTIFANNLPGAGCIYLKSENRFLKPVYLNEPVHFKVEVTDVIKEKKRVIFRTSAISKDVECIVGKAELYIPD
ncbi:MULTISPECIES: MaoC family dehydratase [Acinetobacter calcoaceticus/baumannii complex]|uniref:MaoC family dehydratase n=1 Tax=Acinetobacter calcoaceticus/baumannii complex TaxID=909768 RepID=UPI001B81A18C|nr:MULTISPECIES: MaoC family dehydratase [Acinetobacter calcoaceticus/baumannii complex]MBR7714720.1 MaoC family dehydratase [Acinetobacter nosocomialis]MDF0627190.1 MaoC family dehydratase [Acinetobacter nosocomialis]BCZ12518.1 (R)-hydratase [Acinetobacter baumannii]